MYRKAVEKLIWCCRYIFCAFYALKASSLDADPLQPTFWIIKDCCRSALPSSIACIVSLPFVYSHISHRNAGKFLVRYRRVSRPDPDCSTCL